MFFLFNILNNPPLLINLMGLSRRNYDYCISPDKDCAKLSCNLTVNHELKNTNDNKKLMKIVKQKNKIV